jgi:PKD domain
MPNRTAFFVAAMLALPAAAQTISAVTVEPAVAKAGAPVKVTVALTSAESPNCNLRLHFGDGKTRDFKVNQTKDVPVIATYTYATAGEYRVMAEGKTALPMLKCAGPNQVAMLRVEAATSAAAPAAAPVPAPAAAPASPAAPPPAAAAASPSCPAGWKVNARSVNKKTGAYTCTAKAGTAPPVSKLECKAPLGYFENRSKGQLGCRP